MAIEIRELYIRAVVDAGEKTPGVDSAAREVEGAAEANNENLIELCVEKVLEILKEKTER